jgi:DNA-binding HxlR family transcriptional regulator
MKLELCPVRNTFKIIGGKWKAVIIYELMQGPLRSGELRRRLPDATKKVITEQLRQLERDGIVARKSVSEKSLKVEYGLTRFGRTLKPVLRELCRWGSKLPA